jgi:hypothetical protein
MHQPRARVMVALVSLCRCQITGFFSDASSVKCSASHILAAVLPSGSTYVLAMDGGLRTY